MPTLTTDAGMFYDLPAQRIYTRTSWSDQWQQIEWLWCEELTLCAAPSIPTARLYAEYGQVLRFGTSSWQIQSPQDLVGKWVQIEIDQPNGQPLRWYGRIVEELRERHGRLTDRLAEGQPPVTAESGVQQWIAYGLLHELDRAYVIRSQVKTSGGEESIGRAIAFNGLDEAQSHLELRPNMSPQNGARGSRIFARTLDDAEAWTASEIIKYLLAYHTARDTAGNVVLDWQYIPQGGDFLTWYKPIALEVHGQSIKQILDTLIDRRRLSGYYVAVNPATEKPQIVTFSFAVDPITLDQGTVLPANPTQWTLNFESALDVEANDITSTVHGVQRVRVMGARRGAIGTISYLDGTLVRHWTSTQQNQYNVAASGDPGYASAERWRKEQLNDRARQRPEVMRVYRYFGLPQNWDGMVKDGEGGTANPLSPSLNENGNPTSNPSPFWTPGIRFEEILPLYTDRDYNVSQITPQPAPILQEGAKPELRDPLVLIKLSNDPDHPDYGKYLRLSHVGTGRTEEEGDGGRDWTAHIRMQTGGPGIVININQPAAQHVIAKADFVPRPASECEEIPADLNWKDNLLATVYWLTDEYVEAVWPADADLPQSDAIREQIISVGDQYQLIYVAPGTVVDVRDGQLVRTSGGGWLRDDRAALRRIARIAYEWYRRPRRALSLVYRQARGLVAVGEMIRYIGPPGDEREINSVVTSLSIDMVQVKTAIQTDYGELDALALYSSRPAKKPTMT